ncbi:putative glycosyl transferase [Kordia sp. SMS9]|uniref:glycosyltransferase family 2 protein n=1 Tax=Kordia sp. SMS9 TaxID=2282170 RepID=UPI000E0E0780|nr:glycosyltransferase [Kordia sp. SMS9]AXG70810.1 putative glycosyl transferase [Kordia sp. SMS9]
MKIIAVIATHNRCQLLKRALQSVMEQRYTPNAIFVVSDSDPQYHEAEEKICQEVPCTFLKNKRTSNYAGALNTALEAIIKVYDLTNNLYVAFLDDDDTWHTDYLHTIIQTKQRVAIYLTNIIRIAKDHQKKMQLPLRLSDQDFLMGNPGIGGSNTFVRLKTLLQAGAFDEAMKATVDRDLFVRLFQLQATYQILQQHLVNVYVDVDRPRITTNATLKKESYQYFFYKYKTFMDAKVTSLFYKRAQHLFHIPKEALVLKQKPLATVTTAYISFSGTKDFFFIIGFIAGNIHIANRILKSIKTQKIPVDRILIINNTDCHVSQFQALAPTIECTIIPKSSWQQNLQNDVYGAYFSKFTTINSIAIGRTILQYHLYDETIQVSNPVYWIIDDDVTFSNTFCDSVATGFDLFNIIQQYKDNTDVLIGSVSRDAPLPLFSCIRGQLVDAWYSASQLLQVTADFGDIRSLPDAYYDLSDAYTHHTETPIFYKVDIQKDLPKCFSGKAISRPALQKKLQGEHKLATNRGPNTLVFNKEVLRSYPVAGIEINDTFARRSDLSWALMNQVFSKYDFVVHTMALDQNRPLQAFQIEKELQKSAYDIIGYAFNKALLATVKTIKQENEVQRPIHIIESIAKDAYASVFYEVFESYVLHRKSRFLMNYHRIHGLLELLSKTHEDTVATYKEQFTESALQKEFVSLLDTALDVTYVKRYLMNLGDILWSYAGAITEQMAQKKFTKAFVKQQLQLTKNLYMLGKGSEGRIFTDYTYVYKAFFAIREDEWSLLQQLATHFHKSDFLESLDFYEVQTQKYIRYPFHDFQLIETVSQEEMIALLSFSYQHGFVFTNIKPTNFIRTKSGQLKLIDYGKSFERYTEKRFINSVKRACILIQFPTLAEDKFKEYIKMINTNTQLTEIAGWENMWKTITSSTTSIHTTIKNTQCS